MIGVAVGIAIALSAPFIQASKLKKNKMQKSAGIDFETKMQIKVGLVTAVFFSIFSLVVKYLV